LNPKIIDNNNVTDPDVVSGACVFFDRDSFCLRWLFLCADTEKDSEDGSIAREKEANELAEVPRV
jgi:hypothetical protein